jgi:nucleoside-diphosphate-sugar epimerase
MEDLKGRSILLTGAGGYLGGVVYEHLKKLDIRVIGIERPEISQYNDSFVSIDLESQNDLKKLNTKGSLDAVIHFAAVLPGKSSDGELLIANQKMTYNIVEWAVENKVSSFIFASSCSVYGYSSEPKSESDLPEPQNIYALSKHTCENVVRIIGKQTGMNTCFLRISAPYGPRMKRKAVIKTFAELAHQSKPIVLMGSGSRSQDFVYEDDVASAVISALYYNATGVFNISSSHSVSMKNLAEMILSIYDQDSERIIYRGEDPQESYRGCYPIHNAKKAFGYQPQVLLEDGLRRAVKSWGFL